MCVCGCIRVMYIWVWLPEFGHRKDTKALIDYITHQVGRVHRAPVLAPKMKRARA